MEETMRRTLRSAIWIAGLTLGLGLTVGAVSHAGTEPPPIPLDEFEALDPANEDIDVDAAEQEFTRLAVLVTESTDTSSFGGSSSLTGPCGGMAFSYAENGDLIDAAIDLGDSTAPIDLVGGGQAFTSGNPFKVDTQGIVAYFGFMPQTGDGPQNHSWSIKTSGVSLDSGGDPNELGNNRNAGIVNLKDDLPFKFSAKVQISGELTSDNLAACTGEGYVEFEGDGLLGPMGIFGLFMLGGGFVGLLFNARPAMTFKG
jgi:hypothetical protein